MAYTQMQRRQHIMELQKYLHALSIMNGNIPLILPDGLYGPETSAAVKAFQNNSGLPVTGTADTVTWRRIVGEYRGLMSRKPMSFTPFPDDGHTVSQGESGEIVYIIQSILYGYSQRFDNFPEVIVSGSFCGDTAGAVKYFQQLTGLPLTGRVDPATWNMLVMAR